MPKITVAPPTEFRFTKGQAEAFLSTWFRVVDEEYGSTIAYVPDITTAERIAELLRGEY